MINFNFPWIKSENRVYFWTFFWAISAFVGTWVILKFQVMINPKAAALWFTGIALSGAVVGMIFAIPKVLSNDASLNIQPNAPRLLQENTNLFQISDWLTKTIVGAGLVEMKNIPSFVLKVATRMSEGIAVNGNVLGARSFCAGIIIYALSFGFILGYLITRLVINRLLEDN